MTRLIDADALAKVKFHGYPEIEITPSDANAEAYKRGWNDAIDAIIENGPSIDAVPVRKGYWMDAWRSILDGTRYWYRACSECGYERNDDDTEKDTNFCPNCGAELRERKEE